MVDWNQPDVDVLYTDFPDEMRALIAAALTLEYNGHTNVPDDVFKYDRTTKKFYIRTAGAWVEKEITGLADGAVATAAKLASDVVTTAKILNANVTTAKIADDAVTTVKILDANVTTGKLATNAVTTVKITDANVTAAKLATDSVTTVKITDLNVTTAKVANGAITEAKLDDDAASRSCMMGTFFASHTSGATTLCSREPSAVYTSAVIMPKAGKLTHITAAAHATITIGSATATLLKNGVSTGDFIVIFQNTNSNWDVLGPNAISFVAGDFFQVQITGSHAAPNPIYVTVDLFGHFTA